MNKPDLRRIALLALPIALAAASSCDEGVISGKMPANIPPVLDLTNGPVEGDSVNYNVHFYWIGDDPDGNIDHYEIALVTGRPTGFDPADTTGKDKWTSTRSTDTLMMVQADSYDTTVTINNAKYAVHDRIQTFFIRAVDDRGGLSPTLYRSFTSWTLAPTAFITSPRVINPDGGLQLLCPVVQFKWYGKDPIDYPWNYQNVDSTRFLITYFYTDIVTDLNLHPENFAGKWSKWKSISAPGDSGVSTIIGDDEDLPTGRSYTFAVQAKDEAGAVSSIFDVRSNVCCYRTRTPTGPMLTIREPYLGIYSFLGVDMFAERIKIPPGFETKFSWTASAGHYGAYVSTFRYGWDISDITNPSEWATLPSPAVTATIPRIFFSGVHTLYVESADNLGIKTLGIIELTVIPIVMTKDLLWVDDFPSKDFPQTNYAYPTESEHDAFWLNVCMRIPDFNPARDIYDVAENQYNAPPMELLWQYRNAIWSFSSAIDALAGSRWTQIMMFMPEEIFGTDANLNVLSYYMEFGGHLWTEGQSERTGGLAAVLIERRRIFPNYLRREAVPEWIGPPRDTLGVKCFAYKDFCVTVLDKIEGVFKTDIPFYHNGDLDEMRYGYLDGEDPMTAAHQGLPRRLELWSQVTAPGMFFDPNIRGFTYAEVYNPKYWMDYMQLRTQSCFHPMYRMRAQFTRSVLDRQTIAFWTTKYAGVVAPVEGTVPAPSVHFGLPLWFFNREQVDSIADVIFEAWDIK